MTDLFKTTPPRLPTNTDYEFKNFKKMFKMLFNDEEYNKHEFMRFSDINLRLPQKLKHTELITPFNYYVNKIEEPLQKTEEDEIRELEKKQDFQPSEIERLTQIYGLKEHETYDVEKYKILMQKWKNLTERISELTLNNYGIYRPTPIQAKKQKYVIDFSPLFYKLTKITDETSQRILKNIYYHLNPLSPEIPRTSTVRINENGELFITHIGQTLPPVQSPMIHREISPDDHRNLQLLKDLLNRHYLRNYTLTPIVGSDDEIYDLVDLFYDLQDRGIPLQSIQFEEQKIKKDIKQITSMKNYRRFLRAELSASAATPTKTPTKRQ